MAAWLGWVIVAGACAVAELVTLALVMGMIALAAGVAAGAAVLGVPVAFQVVLFALLALALLAGVRPIAQRHLTHSTPEMRTGVAALIGREAYVLEQVGPHGGRVRIGGEVWSARAYDGHQVIPAGATVDVLSIEGATALVHSMQR